MFLRTAVGFDLDSTLCDTRHRWHLSPMADPESSWAVYCAARTGDTPIAGTVAAARLHYLYNQIHIWSGSESSSDAVTRRWLNRHRVPFDDLRQRPLGDDRPNAEVKIGFIEELRARGIETVLYFEDIPDVAAEIHEKTGVPVLVVNPCYPEDLDKFRHGVHDGMGGGL
jgi:FMN phosphatase YigB (HAD superfamily)